MISFNEYFEIKKGNSFQKMKEMKIPKKNNDVDLDKLQEYWDKSPKLLEDFKKLKNPKGLPPISELFLTYIDECLDDGVVHSPINYTTESGKDSFRFASPEVIEEVWINMKSVIVWYNQLIGDGYYLNE